MTANKNLQTKLNSEDIIKPSLYDFGNPNAIATGEK